MHTISANDLKKRGISASCDKETLVTIRGRPAYVILSLDQYESLTMAELELAIAEAGADYKKGRYVVESVEKHIKRITR
jgi:PHD/YefM family antitoxin component YafN of YafNO toxin-antitoxin module